MATDKKNGQATGAAPALEKGLDILELLSDENRSMTLREVAEALGRSKNELYRMANVLIMRGYLERRADDMITLTSKLFEVGLRTPQTHELVALASPIIQDLANRVKNSVYLAVPNRGEIVVIAAASGIEDVNFSLKLGYHRPLIRSHSGLVFLAFKTESELEKILRSFDAADPGVNFSDDVQNQLNDIRSRGYLISPSQDTLGVTDIVAPVLLGNDEPIAVLAVNHLDRESEPPDKHERALEFLRAACVQLSGLLDDHGKNYIV